MKREGIQRSISSKKREKRRLMRDIGLSGFPIFSVDSPTGTFDIW